MIRETIPDTVTVHSIERAVHFWRDPSNKMHCHRNSVTPDSSPRCFLTPERLDVGNGRRTASVMLYPVCFAPQVGVEMLTTIRANHIRNLIRQCPMVSK